MSAAAGLDGEGAAGIGGLQAELAAQTLGYLSPAVSHAPLKQAIANGEHIEIRGFGTFKVKERKERMARNPRTGESVGVPAKKVPYFKASNELKARLNPGQAADAEPEQEGSA